MMRVVFLFFLLFTTGYCFSQVPEVDDEIDVKGYMEKLRTQYDHLVPVNSFFDTPDYLTDYYALTNDVLLKGLGDESLIRMIVLPSFEPEYVINIDLTEGEYFLTYCRSDKSIWEEKGHQVKVIKQRKRISCELAVAYKTLYELAVSQTKYSQAVSDGVDGDTYFFSCRFNAELRTAKKWSPIEGSKIYEVVELTNLLVSEEPLETEIIRRVESLIDSF